MTYPNGTRVSVSNTPNVENGEIGFVTGYLHHKHLLQVQFPDRTVFCGAENCFDTGRSKDEKIKEVMGLVDAYAHHERMQDAEASAQCREFVESKLRELIQ